MLMDFNLLFQMVNFNGKCYGFIDLMICLKTFFGLTRVDGSRLVLVNVGFSDY